MPSLSAAPTVRACASPLKSLRLRTSSKAQSAPDSAAEARAPRRAASEETSLLRRRMTRCPYTRSTALRTESTVSGTPGSETRAASGSEACVLIGSEATRTGDADPRVVVFLIGIGDRASWKHYAR